MVPWEITLFMACEKRALEFDDAATVFSEKVQCIFVQQKEPSYCELFFRCSNVIISVAIAPIDLGFCL